MTELTVRAFVEAINAHDPNRIFDLSAPGFTLVGACGERVEGREAARNAWRRYFASVPDYRIEVSEILSAGNRAAVFGHAGGVCQDVLHPDVKKRWRLPAAWRAAIEGERVEIWQIHADPKIPCEAMEDADRKHAAALHRSTEPIEFVESTAPADSVAAGEPDCGMVRNPVAAPELVTERLRLRAFVAQDAGALFDCCRNPHLGDNAGWKSHESVEESRSILETVFLCTESVWAVTDRSSGRLIGSVGLLPDPKRENPGALMLGYWLDEAYWGRGLMSEAAAAVVGHGFDALGAELITVCCYAHNRRSKRLIERLGFRFEGTLHAGGRNNRGEVLDVLSYYLPASGQGRFE